MVFFATVVLRRNVHPAIGWRLGIGTAGGEFGSAFDADFGVRAVLVSAFETSHSLEGWFKFGVWVPGFSAVWLVESAVDVGGLL